MPANNPAHRALIARIAAAERWGKTTDCRAATKPARDGLRAKFEREADPDGALPPEEVARRAEHLMRAHMLRMSLRAAQGRRRANGHPARSEAATVELDDLGGDKPAGLQDLLLRPFIHLSVETRAEGGEPR